jgi:hypothetical protein
MSTFKDSKKLDDLEPYEDAVRRHRQQLKSTMKGRPLKLLSRFLAAADCQRGLVAPPNV